MLNKYMLEGREGGREKGKEREREGGKEGEERNSNSLPKGKAILNKE